MNTFQIENHQVIKTTRNSALKNLIKYPEHIIKYNIENEFKLDSLPALGVENGYYFFNYEIERIDDIITNIRVEPSYEIKLAINGYVVDIPENYHLYPFLFPYTKLELRVYFEYSEQIDTFKIFYKGYILNHELRRDLASKNYFDLTNWMEPVKI